MKALYLGPWVCKAQSQWRPRWPGPDWAPASPWWSSPGRWRTTPGSSSAPSLEWCKWWDYQLPIKPCYSDLHHRAGSLLGDWREAWLTWRIPPCYELTGWWCVLSPDQDCLTGGTMYIYELTRYKWIPSEYALSSFEFTSTVVLLRLIGFMSAVRPLFWRPSFDLLMTYSSLCEPFRSPFYMVNWSQANIRC